MSDYKKMYYTLFNAITDATQMLLAAQREAEEIFVDQDETTGNPTLAPNAREATGRERKTG